MSEKSPSSKNIPTNYWLMRQGVLENLAGRVQILFFFYSVSEMTWNSHFVGLDLSDLQI